MNPVVPRASETLLTPAVKALIGQETPVRKMHGVIDEETVRRYVHGIPDQDPRHWDESKAKPRFGARTVPQMLATLVAGRKPPWEKDKLADLMRIDPFNDAGAAMTSEPEDGLPSVRDVAKMGRHLNGGQEVEVYQYPKIGDSIFFQSRVVDIQEKVDREGRPFLLTTGETRYWNQDDQLLLITRGIGIHRP